MPLIACLYAQWNVVENGISEAGELALARAVENNRYGVTHLDLGSTSKSQPFRSLARVFECIGSVCSVG